MFESLISVQFLPYKWLAVTLASTFTEFLVLLPAMFESLISVQLLPYKWLAVTLASTFTTFWKPHFPQVPFPQEDKNMVHPLHCCCCNCFHFLPVAWWTFLLHPLIMLHWHPTAPQNKGMLMKQMQTQMYRHTTTKKEAQNIQLMTGHCATFNYVITYTVLKCHLIITNTLIHLCTSNDFFYDAYKSWYSLEWYICQLLGSHYKWPTRAFLMQQGLPFCTTNFLCSQAYIACQRVMEIGNVLKMASSFSTGSLFFSCICPPTISHHVFLWRWGWSLCWQRRGPCYCCCLGCFSRWQWWDGNDEMTRMRWPGWDDQDEMTRMRRVRWWWEDVDEIVGKQAHNMQQQTDQWVNRISREKQADGRMSGQE